MKNKSQPKTKQNSSPVCYAESNEIRPEFKEVSTPINDKAKQSTKAKK